MNWLEQALQTEYDVVGPVGQKAVRLRHKELQQDLLEFQGQGDAAVYRRLMRLSHPNIAGILDVYEEQDQITVLEEFIDGTTVSDLLTAGLYTEEGVRSVCSALCDALYALHSIGIIHRDIKPENVMIETGGRVVLIDFDAARIFKNGQSRDTQVLGTAGYAAPEQFGIAQTDERADLYSVGILMNVMLTGCHPSVRLYDGKLRRIIERCTHIDPNRRYKDAAQLKKSLY